MYLVEAIDITRIYRFNDACHYEFLHFIASIPAVTYPPFYTPYCQVRRQSQVFDIVITSGGVGPTHDDVTIKSVAEAFGQRMSMNPRMLRTLVHKVRE
jgi:hypothetical protein